MQFSCFILLWNNDLSHLNWSSMMEDAAVDAAEDEYAVAAGAGASGLLVGLLSFHPYGHEILGSTHYCIDLSCMLGIIL